LRPAAVSRKVPVALSEGRLTALAELIESFNEEEARKLSDALEEILSRREEIASHRPDAKGLST
jgi:hypothetical protein